MLMDNFIRIQSSTKEHTKNNQSHWEIVTLPDNVRELPVLFLECITVVVVTGVGSFVLDILRYLLVLWTVCSMTSLPSHSLTRMNELIYGKPHVFLKWRFPLWCWWTHYCFFRCLKQLMLYALYIFVHEAQRKGTKKMNDTSDVMLHVIMNISTII